jgi:hypothetical protein
MTKANQGKFGKTDVKIKLVNQLCWNVQSQDGMPNTIALSGS